MVSPTEKDSEAYDFLRNGSLDTDFLRDNGISIVYTRIFDGNRNTDYISGNPDLVEVSKDIYLLKDSNVN